MINNYNMLYVIRSRLSTNYLHLFQFYHQVMSVTRDSGYKNAEKIRNELKKFYEQCQDAYLAPITLPSFRCPDKGVPLTEAAIEATRHLRIFADTPVPDEPVFCQLFPPLEEILPAYPI